MLKLGHNCRKASTNCSSGSAKVMFLRTVGLRVSNTSRKLNLHLHSWELVFWRQRAGDNCEGAMNDPCPGRHEVPRRMRKIRRKVDEIWLPCVTKRSPGCSNHLNKISLQDTAQLPCWEIPRFKAGLGGVTPSVMIAIVSSDLQNSDQKTQSHAGKGSRVLPEQRAWDTQQAYLGFK